MRIPATFEKNLGQSDAKVQYSLRGKSHAVHLRRNDVLVSLRGKGAISQLKLSFPGSSKRPSIVAEEPHQAKTSYFRGSDPRRWVRDVPSYGRVRYTDIYSGIDLVYYSDGERLEYDFVVKPGIDPRAINMSFRGASSARVDGTGALVLNTPAGDVVQSAPVLYQTIGHRRVEVAGRFSSRSNGTFGFEVGPYNRELPLVIDPVLSFSTYLGGTSTDVGRAVASDAAGNVYVAGLTDSAGFPVTAGARPAALAGRSDVFVAKFGPTGTLLYSTIWGGSDTELVTGIAVDATGNVAVYGSTYSVNVPVVDAFQAQSRGGTLGLDCFFFLLNPTGSALLASSYLGGNDDDLAGGIAIDREGAFYLSGSTGSVNFPTTPGVYQAGNRGVLDAFVVKLGATGKNIVYGTLFGGSDADVGAVIAVDAQNNVYLAGHTGSTNLPLSTTAFQSTKKPGGGAFPYDAFVAKLSSTGATLVYSTYVGATGEDSVEGIVVDADGSAFVVGYTVGTDFPSTAGALQSSLAGTHDGFVFKLNPTGSALTYSTYFGGSRVDDVYGVALGTAGTVWIAGTTSSTNLPMQNPLKAQIGGSVDGYVAQLNASGSAVLNSTYVGGNGLDIVSGVAADARNNVVVIGQTDSTDLAASSPTAHQKVYGGGSYDAFVTRIDFSAPAPTLAVAPRQFTFTGPAGGTIASQTLSITSPQGTNLAWTAEARTTSGGNWLNINPNRGTGTGSISVFPTISNLPPGTYAGTITVIATAAGTRTEVPVSLTVTEASNVIPANGVVNGASFQGGAVAPGEIITIYGLRIGPSVFTGAELSAAGLLENRLAETRVLFDGVPAPLIYVWENQISVIVPYAVAGRTTTQMQVEFRNTRSNVVTLNVAAAAPGFFTQDSSGRGPGAFHNQDTSRNTPDNPAEKGSVVVLYATGEGQTTPAGIDGKLATDPYPKPNLPVTVTIGGEVAQIQYVGATPGQVAGLLQINVVVPANAPSGAAVPVSLSIGGVQSPAGATISIR